MSKHFLRMGNEWLEVQRSCLHLCCRPFSRTPLKGFTTPKSQLSITPSHSRVGTHPHIQPQKEHPLFTQKSEPITGRCPSLFYLQKLDILIHLIEETHTRNFYFVVSSLESPLASCLTETTTPHRQKRLSLDWGEEMRVPNEQDGSLKIQDFRGKGCTEMQKLIT